MSMRNAVTLPEERELVNVNMNFVQSFKFGVALFLGMVVSGILFSLFSLIVATGLIYLFGTNLWN